MLNYKNDYLRDLYTHEFYEIQTIHYFKDILYENINNRIKEIKLLTKGFFKSKSKKLKIRQEIDDIKELMNSYKSYSVKLDTLIANIKDIHTKIVQLKEENVEDEHHIEKKIFFHANEISPQTKLISEQILDNLQEIQKINEALVLCDLIHLSHGQVYERNKIYGVHQHEFIFHFNDKKKQMNQEDLLRELKSVMILINKRLEYRKQERLVTSLQIKEKVSLENLVLIIHHLLSHIRLLEKDIDSLKEKRIQLLRTYCE